MAHDVFISHSTKDKVTADAVCAVLESHGVRCWVAPRDIIPGADWKESVVTAIKNSRVMVLVLSGHANESPQIDREVTCAMNNEVHVIPMRIENIVPSSSLSFFLSSSHWLDAFIPPLEEHLRYLTEVIQKILAKPIKPAPPPEPIPVPAPKPVPLPKPVPPPKPVPVPNWIPVPKPIPAPRPIPAPKPVPVPPPPRPSRVGRVAALALVVLAIGLIYKIHRDRAEQFPGFSPEPNAPDVRRTWTIPPSKIDLVLIAPGTFAMGTASVPAVLPVTQVTITKAFWLGKTAVTQRQWESVMGTTVRQQMEKARMPMQTIGGKMANVGLLLCGEGRDYPMYYVSWDDATEFCRKLTQEERAAGRLPDGCVYTLPTEAQREFACRAGMNGDYPGDLDAMSWYGKNSNHTTHPVGLKQPNSWGLCDMNGDVWEWCQDWLGDYPGGSVTDPTGPSSGSLRVFRGGNWTSDAADCRSASRYGIAPSARLGDLGFRVALCAVR